MINKPKVITSYTDGKCLVPLGVVPSNFKNRDKK